MTADEILKKHEDENEMHFHNVDRNWIIKAMEDYAALCQSVALITTCQCKGNRIGETKLWCCNQCGARCEEF